VDWIEWEAIEWLWWEKDSKEEVEWEFEWDLLCDLCGLLRFKEWGAAMKQDEMEEESMELVVSSWEVEELRGSLEEVKLEFEEELYEVTWEMVEWFDEEAGTEEFNEIPEEGEAFE
jgi:hypothetical protein